MNESINIEALLITLVVYLLSGFMLRLAHTYWHFLTESAWQACRFMADLDIVALLFMLGLFAHPSTLATKLSQAIPALVGRRYIDRHDEFCGGLLFARRCADPVTVCRAVLTCDHYRGIAIATWEESRATDTTERQVTTLPNMAKLNDISAVSMLCCFG